MTAPLFRKLIQFHSLSLSLSFSFIIKPVLAMGISRSFPFFIPFCAAGLIYLSLSLLISFQNLRSESSGCNATTISYLLDTDTKVTQQSLRSRCYSFDSMRMYTHTPAVVFCVSKSLLRFLSRHVQLLNNPD